MRIFLWVAFIATIIFLYPVTSRISSLAGPQNSIIKAELACKSEGICIINAWSSVKYNGGTLLDEARIDTHWDFLFILIYVLLIIKESNTFMVIEPDYLLNELLRLNIFLAIIAGLLDITENILILHNLTTASNPSCYIPSMVPSALKFILSAWCVVVWIAAIIHQIILARRKPAALPVHVAYMNSVIYSKEAIIKKRNMGKFDLIAYLNDNNNSIEFRVKDAILYTFGDNDPDPSEIANDRDMADLNFQDYNFIKLTQRFNVIIYAMKPGAAGVDVKAVEGYTDVQACIDGVTALTV